MAMKLTGPRSTATLHPAPYKVRVKGGGCFWMSIGFSLLLAGGAARPAAALIVSPGRTEIRLSPGEEIRGSLTATNDGPDRLHVTLSTKDWFVLEVNKTKNLTVDTWLTLKGAKEFDLKPGASREIKFTVKCPPEAEGELVGMVSLLHTKNASSTMTPMISVSVYLEVAGTEQRAGEIEELVVRKWNDAIQAAIAVKSTGNVHLRPTGTFVIHKKSGEELGRFPVKEGGPAYPGRNQAYFALVPPDFKLDPGRYVVQADLEYRGLTLKSERGFTVLKQAKNERDGTIEMDPLTPEGRTSTAK